MTRAWLSMAVAALTLAAAVVPGVLAAPDERPITAGPLQLSGASLTVSCPLTIGGGFEARTADIGGGIALDPARPGIVTGALVVDLRTLQTGIALRDTHMREKYLEVWRGTSFAVSTLDRIRLIDVDSARLEGKARFEGVLLLHGREHPVAGAADIRRSNQALRVQATFPVKLSAFDIPAPIYLGVGVADEVLVSVRFQAAPNHLR